jgi:uncharacterized OsmC-like protein
MDNVFITVCGHKNKMYHTHVVLSYRVCDYLHQERNRAIQEGMGMASESPEISKATEPAQIEIRIDQIKDYQFRVTFDKEQYPELLIDEPPPLGNDTAPNPSRLLAASVGNCLAASFLFSARKVRAGVESLHATVKVWYTRNERGRLRIGRIEVGIVPKFDPADAAKIERCIGLFEDYCVVTQSVRGGIEVAVAVNT